MPAGTNKNIAVIATVAVMVPILVGAWFALPMFAPVFLWTKVDLRKIASTTKVDEARLKTQFKLQVRYNPRGDGDPLPWQIISMEPAWKEVYPEQEDEAELLVRCTFVSGNDGRPPGTAFINSTFKDRYFRATGLRLPPGSLGFNPKRPVVVYNQLDLAKMSITDADGTQRNVSGWENDDEWDERDDGWTTSGQ
ncbi:MAG: hypothetical protein J0M02_03765 [Planctomycetes bacterium]|nr:hypothetical protein [Planctomycetota bacterium]